MKTIAIVGLGALGSHAALALRNAGKLHLIDFDTVEQKNTLAQFHTKQSMRQNKANALKRALFGLWQVSADSEPHKVTPDSVGAILQHAELVLDCTDNIAARTTLRDYCQEADIPLLHGAMSADGTFAQVAWREDFTPDPESGNGATCEDGENLPFHLLVGSQMAVVAKIFLTTGQKRCFHVMPGGIVRV